MKKTILVAVMMMAIFAFVLCGCRQANQVPGASAVASAVASVLPAMSPTPLPTVTLNTSSVTTMPTTSALATAKSK